MGCLIWIRGLKITCPFEDKEFIKRAAFFNFLTFLLTCAALVQPSWFKIRGLYCSERLSLVQFFTFDDDNDDVDQSTIHMNIKFDPFNQYILKGPPPCTGPLIITLMKVIILLCFMVLLCSCIGVLINIISLNSKMIKKLRRNAVPSVMCVFWVIGIAAICFIMTSILEGQNSINSMQVKYEYGFYMITGAGIMSLLASAANMWGAPVTNEDIQSQNLMEDWEDYEAHSVGPTPAVPTLPPYTPSANYVSTANPTFPPPALGTQQYFPFDDLSILPPPPPYTP